MGCAEELAFCRACEPWRSDAKLRRWSALARAMEQFYDAGRRRASWAWLGANHVADARDAQRDRAAGDLRVQRSLDRHDRRVHANDCALTVLATVVSTSVTGQAVIDAGSKALGREPRTRRRLRSVLEHPDVIVDRMWTGGSARVARPTVGRFGSPKRCGAAAECADFSVNRVAAITSSEVGRSRRGDGRAVHRSANGALEK